MAGQNSGSTALIVRCTDQARGCVKDFHTDTVTVLSSMRYFKEYLRKLQTGQELTISVHCDVQIFELLLRLAAAQQQGELGSTDLLTLDNVLPVLISSSFLGMEEVVELCIFWIASNLVAVAQHSADLTALPHDLLTRIARACSERSLEDLHTLCVEGGASTSGASTPRASTPVQGAASALQRQQQLSSRLYKLKLETMLKDLRTTVVRCAHCGAMYSLADRGKLACSARHPSRLATSSSAGPSAAGSLLPLGQPSHEPDPSWRLQDHLAALRGSSTGQGQQGSKEGRVAVASWRDIYWDVWGVVHVLYCHHCLAWFPAQELGMCPFHPEPPIFMAHKASGRYPCCGGHVLRSGTSSQQHSSSPGAGSAAPQMTTGCCVREHAVLASSPLEPIMPLVRTTSISNNSATGSMPADQPGGLVSPSAAESAATAASGVAVWQTLQEWHHLIVPDVDPPPPKTATAECNGSAVINGSSRSPKAASAFGQEGHRGSFAQSSFAGSSFGLGGEEDGEGSEGDWEGIGNAGNTQGSRALRPYHSAQRSQQQRPLQQQQVQGQGHSGINSSSGRFQGAALVAAGATGASSQAPAGCCIGSSDSQHMVRPGAGQARQTHLPQQCEEPTRAVVQGGWVKPAVGAPSSLEERSDDRLQGRGDQVAPVQQQSASVQGTTHPLTSCYDNTDRDGDSGAQARGSAADVLTVLQALASTAAGSENVTTIGPGRANLQQSSQPGSTGQQPSGLQHRMSGIQAAATSHAAGLTTSLPGHLGSAGGVSAPVPASRTTVPPPVPRLQPQQPSGLVPAIGNGIGTSLLLLSPRGGSGSTQAEGILARSPRSPRPSVHVTSTGAPSAAAAAATAALLAAAGVSSLSPPGSGFHGFKPTGSAASRKLRLELLHEDDNIRMEALIMHLAACRPARSPGMDPSKQPPSSISKSGPFSNPAHGRSSSNNAHPVKGMTRPTTAGPGRSSSVERSSSSSASAHHHHHPPSAYQKSVSMGRPASTERPAPPGRMGQGEGANTTGQHPVSGAAAASGGIQGSRSTAHHPAKGRPMSAPRARGSGTQPIMTAWAVGGALLGHGSHAAMAGLQRRPSLLQRA